MTKSKIRLHHKTSPDVSVTIEQLDSGKNKISVETKNKTLFIPFSCWETAYDVDLIKEIFSIKGPVYLCDEIMRDESPNYLQRGLTYSMLSYVDKAVFKNKRILDFGCGSASSTMILGRLFPDAQIVGIDLEEKLLNLARLRAHYYNFDSISFLHSPDPNNLPKNIGTFDYIVLSAVFEHLLPGERKTLLPQIWNHLNPGGILFINRTPYRYFPLETHTTGGVPFINFLPDRLTLWCAQKFSRKNLKNLTWQTLLREGIRGGSVRELLKLLQKGDHKPVLLKPTRLGIKDRVDLWYNETNPKRYGTIKKILFFCLKLLKKITGITVVPTLSLAIKKQS